MRRLGVRLKELREMKTVSRPAEIKDVAQDTGIDSRIISNLEAGTRKDINAREICALTAYYGLEDHVELYRLANDDDGDTDGTL